MISLIPDLTKSDANQASVNDVVDHILYVAERIGFAHIGIGSDFDGMEKGVAGVEDASKFPNLVACMIHRGVTTSDIELIIGRNLIRVMESVEDTVKRLRDSTVLEDEVKQLWDERFRAWVRAKYPGAEKDNRHKLLVD